MLKKLSKTSKNIILKGSLISLSLLIMIIPQAALAASSLEMEGISKPEEMTLDAAKKGIVRVLAGTEDSEGNFERKSVASGFIVSDTGNEVRIVTTLHSVDFGDDSIVKVAVKNDLAVDAAVEKFPEKDFCILTVENKFNDKEMIPIRVSDPDDEDNSVADGDEITVLGFPVSVDNSSDYMETDVSAQSGKIIKTAAENNGFIEHDATITDGCDGGVLTDADGYVIGLINANEAKAMDIKEVDTALYKEGTDYRSKDKDDMYAELYDLCEEAESQYKKADKETKSEISRVYQNGKIVLESSTYDRDALRSALDDYKGVVGNSKRSKKPLILIIALALLIVYLSIRLIMLVKWNKQYNPDEPEAKQNGRRSKAGSKKGISAGRAKVSSAQITVLRTGASYVIDTRMVSLGKSNEADISIPDNNRISRHHARIENNNGVFYLYDSGSTNGTYLNNMQVGGDGIRLVSGDIIRLANEEIEFSIQ